MKRPENVIAVSGFVYLCEVISLEQVATFEKVSLKEYLRARMETKDKEVLGDERYNEFVEKYTREWEGITLPSRATAGSAGYDFYLPIDYNVFDDDLGHLNWPIATGIRAKIKPGWVLMLYPRSGLGFKYGLRLTNTTGIIDSDYYNAENEGHIMAKMVSNSMLQLNAGDRFMQGIFLPFGITENDKAEAERVGGMGSTGV